MKHVPVATLSVGNDQPLTIIAGPCQLESADHAQMVAGVMKEACDAVGAQYIFKSSFDKANRTSANASRGLGMIRRFAWTGPVLSKTAAPLLAFTIRHCD